MNFFANWKLTKEGFVFRFIYIGCALFLLASPLILSTSCPASTLEKLQKQATRNISTEIRAQKELETWENNKAALEAQIREGEMQKAWLIYQNKKYTGYIGDEHATLKDLDARRKEMEEINMRLEPYLDEVVTTLESFIAGDLPFLPEERTRRIGFLRETLQDYHLSLSEKLRRILEAVQVEAEYGRTLEALPAAVSLQGETIQGRIFRLGRTALFFQSIDKRVVAAFDKKTKTWAALSPEYERPLDRAFQIVDRKRAAELLILPVQGDIHE